MKSKTPDHIAYRRDIDGLRTIAVLAVLVFHAFPFLHGGFVGVDIFFVISGYLIAGNILRDIERNTFSIGQFYRRRIARLFPALALVILSTLVAGGTFLMASEYKELAGHAFWGAVGFANISLWSQAGYFDSDALFKPLLHLWSLGVEEQFYLAAPFTLLALSQTKKLLLKILIFLFALSFILHCNFTGYFKETSLFFLPFFRAWELLIGVLLAYSVERKLYQEKKLSIQTRNSISIIGFIMILLSITFLSSKNISAFSLLTPTLGTALLIASGSQAFINRIILSNKVMVGIGLISYPLYLWHWPLLSFLRIMDPENTAIARGAMLAVSFVLAYLTYAFIEKPVRGKTRRSSSLIPYLVGAMACVMVFSQIIIHQKGKIGWAARGGDVDYLFTASQATDKECIPKFWGDALPAGTLVRCSNPDPSVSTEVALIGDSHAHHLFTGVAHYYKKKKQNVVNLTAYGCSLFRPESQDSNDPCIANYRKIFEVMDKNPSIKTVIISEYTPYMMMTENQDYIDKMKSIVEGLTKKGKHVVFMIDVPQLSFSPRDCVARPLQLWQTLKDHCYIKKSEYDINVKTYRSHVSIALDGIKNVTVFDLSAQLCNETSCLGRTEDQFLYRDQSHLTDFGSLFVSRFYDF